MWRPDFDYLEARAALLRGYHRSFCIYSLLYRGTPDSPGLVLGLDRGGSCRGRAFRVAAEHADSVIGDVDAREVIYDVYVRRCLPVVLMDDPARPCVSAYTYVADRSGPQYAGALPWARMIALIRQGHGVSGSSIEYLENTVRHLDELGVPDHDLHALLRDVRRARKA